MNSTAEEVTAGAEALAEHRPVLSRQIGLLFPTACGCGARTAGWSKWEEHKTRVVLAAVLPAHDRRVKAETLREMADGIDAGPTFPLSPAVISELIRECAAAVENGADDEQD